MTAPEPAWEDLLLPRRRRHARPRTPARRRRRATHPQKGTPMSQLLVLAFWKDVLDRAFRQALQVILPLLTLAAASGQVDVKSTGTVAVVAGVQAAVVILRAVSGVRAGDTAPWAVQVLDRSAAAAAGALLAIVSADGFDLLALDGRAVALSVASTVALALVNGYISPPASKPDENEPAPAEPLAA